MDAASDILDLDFRRHASELRETWQAKLLRLAEGQMGAVVLSVLAHNFDDAMPVLLRVVFPGFTSIAAPFLCTAGKISKHGHVCADLVTKDGHIVKMFALFSSSRDMEGAFRRLADRARLSDADRIEMFAAVRRWVVCDYRLDPTFDPADPDAKRLVVN